VAGAGVALASWLSDGRLLAQLRACAAGGGDRSRLLQGPLDFLVNPDAADQALILVAIAAWVVTRPPPGLPAKLLGWTLAGTLAVFLSPGIAENHLLDLDLAAWIALTVCVGSAAVPRRFGSWVLVALAVLSLVRIGPEATNGPLNVRIGQPPRGEVGPPPPALLAEIPVPLQLGERPAARHSPSASCPAARRS
jgi:hypothetical protein